MSRALTTVGLVTMLACAQAAGQQPYPPYPQWQFPPSAPLMDMGRRGMNPPSEFGLVFSVWADQNQWWNIEVSGIPFRQEIINVPAGAGPTYPIQGPHMIELFPGGREAFYTQFLNELRTIITGWCPYPEYEGLIVLDYEWFDPAYTGHFNVPSLESRTASDGDAIDDWRETLRETRAAALGVLTPVQQEEYFRQEWVSTVREFYERTFNAVKQLRPRSKVGFYNHPGQDYWRWRDPAQAALMRRGNTEEAAWFYQMVDVILPSVYPLYYSVPDSQTPAPGQDRERDFESYVRANVGEALRVANGRPVYVYVGFQYHLSNPVYGWQAANDFNMRRPLEIAREMGCNGAVIWGWFQNQTAYNDARTFWQTRYAPFLRQFSLLPAVAPANPVFPSGGGGTNAGASGTGTGSGTGAGSGTGTGTGTGTGGGTGTGTGSTDTGGATGNSGTTGGGGVGAGLGGGSSSGAAGGTSGGTTGGSGVGTVGG
ncbi:MAG: hypothetical protein K2Q09_01990, partial [Phycisphaerales bacterium]|nr:hypothetical protein [Phycisphaerales bacterium]